MSLLLYIIAAIYVIGTSLYGFMWGGFSTGFVCTICSIPVAAIFISQGQILDNQHTILYKLSKMQQETPEIPEKSWIKCQKCGENRQKEGSNCPHCGCS